MPTSPLATPCSPVVNHRSGVTPSPPLGERAGGEVAFLLPSSASIAPLRCHSPSTVWPLPAHLWTFAAQSAPPISGSQDRLRFTLSLGERAGVRARSYPQLTCSPNIRGLCFGVRNLGWIFRFFSLSSSGGEGRGEEAVCSSAS